MSENHGTDQRAPFNNRIIIGENASVEQAALGEHITQIRTEKLEVYIGAHPSDARLFIPNPPAPESFYPPQLPLVGRIHEVLYFQDKLLTEHLAVIAGFRGVGKTTLAAAVARQSFELPEIFWHSFHPGETVEALLWTLAGFLAGHGQRDLWEMLNGVNTSGGSKAPPELLFNYLFQLVRGRGYLLCFDDIQFVEDDPLLQLLLGQLRQEILTGSLSLLVTAWQKPSFVQVLEFEPLAGLSRTDAVAFLQARGVSLDDRQYERLHVRTEGNPQFLSLAANALTQGHDPESLIVELSKTSNVENYLLEQVDENLSGVERKIMSALAVLLGYPATRTKLQAVAGVGGLTRPLNQLANRFLLATRGEGDSREYSQHSIVQGFYYALPSDEERQTLHQRAAQLYREEKEPFLAVLHATRGGHYQEAVQWTFDDIRLLINQGHSAALVPLLEGIPAQPLSEVHTLQIQLALGQLYALLGQQDQAREAYTRAGSVLETPSTLSENRKLVAEACLVIGEYYEHYESPRDGLVWFQRGLQVLGDQDLALEGALHIKTGSAYIALDENQKAIDSVKTGLAFLPDGPSHWRARGLTNLGIAASASGNFGEAAKYAEQTVTMGEALHDKFLVMKGLNNLSYETANLGDRSREVDALERLQKLADELGSVRNQIGARNGLGVYYMEKGDFVLALTHLAQAVEMARAHQTNELLLIALSSMADLKIRSGEGPSAIPLLQEGEQLALQSEKRFILPDIYSSWSLALIGTNLMQAQNLCDKAIQHAQQLGGKEEEGKAWRVAGQIRMSRGEFEDATRAYKQSLALLQSPYERARTEIEYARAILATASSSGEWLARARELLHEAEAKVQSLGAERDISDVTTLLGKLDSL